MANLRKLGVFWGPAGISLVELNKDVPVESAFVSFADLERDPPPGVSHVSGDVRLLDLLRKALLSAPFSVGNAFLSLPATDIIVRWFVIPWVKPEEIEGVVKFEAVKHIPFALDELVYNYYPSTISQDTNRQIGIAFTAIRKVYYERVTNVLIQTGINIVYSEPAAMSLLRSLTLQKFVRTDQVTAIVAAGEDSGEIYITSQGYVKFIRDFSLRSANEIPGEATEEFLRAKFYNEVRISMDFFSRHNAGPEVERIVAISSGIHQSMFDAMSDEIALPIQMVDPYQILPKFNAMPDIGYVRAFGAGLSGAVPSVIDFNLSEGQTHGDQKKIETPKPFEIPKEKLIAGGVAIASVIATLLGVVLSTQMVKAREAAKVEVQGRLGRYADTPQEDIDSKVTLLTKKIESIKSLPFKSELSPLLVHFVQLMPQGMWLEKIDVARKDDAKSFKNILTDDNSGSAENRKLTVDDYYKVKSTLVMSISGNVSLDDTNLEFDSVNQFMDALKADAQIHKKFSVVKLMNLATGSTSKGTRVTNFVIELR